METKVERENMITLRAHLGDACYNKYLHESNGTTVFGIHLTQMSPEDLRVAFSLLGESMRMERERRERSNDFRQYLESLRV